MTAHAFTDAQFLTGIPDAPTKKKTSDHRWDWAARS
jgi:hypothetical protein